MLARFPPLTPEQAAEVEALRAQRAVVNRRIDRVRRLIARLKALEEPLVLQEGELWAMMLDADYATRARNHIASDLARGSYTRDGRLAVDADNKHPILDPKEKRSSHEWTYEKEKLAKFMKANQHPLITKIGELGKKVGGHGGMDFVMAYRMLDCVRQGITPDMTVYDAADWSAILEISARSVKEGSMPIQCPDFTRGGWKTIKPLGIVS